MKANRKKLMLAMARACMDTEDLQKAAEMPRPTLNNAICGKSVKENKHMTILKVTYGNPVASIKGICEHYQISDRTARMIVKELEQERGRYGDYTVLGDGALKRVNFLAFTDYWQFRKMLQDKNARKHVPVYSPQKVARSLGFYGGETYDGSGNPSGN